MKKTSKKKIVFVSDELLEETDNKVLTDILCESIHDYIKETERTID